MSIYEELLAAAETVDFAPRGRMEKTDVFLLRLLRAILKTDKSVWEKLSDGAQAWYIQQARRVNAKLSIDQSPAGYEEALAAASNEGLTDAVRRVVLMHPDLSKPDILKVLESEGWDSRVLQTSQTVAVVRSVTLTTIKIAKSIGRWNETPVLEAAQQ